MMEKGRVIYLNGVTSAGKTSIVEALQDREDVFFYVVANDLFQEMVGERWLRKDYWKELARVVLLMYRTARLISDEGHHVLIDGILVERPQFDGHLRRMLDIFRDSPLEIVEVACPLDVCRARNIARGDRYETQSEEQAALMAPDIPYTLRVETNLHTPQACAEQIVTALFGKESHD